MSIKSTELRYGFVAILLHWTTAVLILVLILSGFRADGMTDSVAKAGVLSLHVPLGISVFLLTLLRLVWWRVADRKPAPLPMPRWQDRSAHAIHVLFYVVILGMGASGMAMLALSGAAPILFGESSVALPDFHDFGPRAPHGLGAMVLVAMFVLHAGAALYHQLVKRDGLLSRMWFGRN